MSKLEQQTSAIVRIAPRIAEFNADAWDACANPHAQTYNPFVSHAFLNALELAGTVGEPKTGWVPQHLALEDTSGALSACMPCYLKLHSSGEYVFDYSWA